MVDLYTVRRRIGGIFYEDVVCARNWEEAEDLAERLGGELTGKIEAEIPVSDEEMQAIFQLGAQVLGKVRTDGYENEVPKAGVPK